MISLAKTALGLFGIIIFAVTVWGMVSERTMDGWVVLVIAGICAISLFDGGE